MAISAEQAKDKFLYFLAAYETAKKLQLNAVDLLDCRTGAAEWAAIYVALKTMGPVAARKAVKNVTK